MTDQPDMIAVSKTMLIATEALIQAQRNLLDTLPAAASMRGSIALAQRNVDAARALLDAIAPNAPQQDHDAPDLDEKYPAKVRA